MLMDEEMPDSVSWEASEYVHHEKDPLWFAIFGIVIAGILTGMYFLLEDVIAIIVILLMAIAVLVFANRRPRSLKYELNDKGITIDNRSYSYSSFKSFSIMDEGAVQSIFLEPLERFMPPISVYFSPDDADKIFAVIGQYLPNRNRQPDLMDRLVHRLRL